MYTKDIFRRTLCNVRSTVEALAHRCAKRFPKKLRLRGKRYRRKRFRTFGVSRSPLREALRRLEAEGMIEYRASRAVVATIDAKESATFTQTP